MEIDGPLLIEVTDDEASNNRKVEIRFRLEFQLLEPQQQVKRMQTYIQRLYQLAQDLGQESADSQGIQLNLPLCEELLAYFPDQSIDLNESITLEMDKGSTAPETCINLMDLKLN